MLRTYEIPNVYRDPYRVTERPALGEGELAIRWLGTAGYELRTTKTTLLIDPYLTRARLGDVALRPLAPNLGEIDRVVTRADYLLTGHSHFDHMMDVPAIAERTGATVVGSNSTCNVAAVSGIPEERLVRITDDRATHKLGNFEVRFIPSEHGRILGWRPFPGRITPGVKRPMRVHEYRMGGAYGIWMRVGELTLHHNGSADLIEPQMDGLRADVVFLGLAGRLGTPDYVRRMTGMLKPRVIVPTHYDFFFTPLASGIRLLPMIKMDEFYATARQQAGDAQVVMPGFLEELRVSVDGSATTRILA